MQQPLNLILPLFNPPIHWEQHVLAAYQVITETLCFPPGVIIVQDGGRPPDSFVVEGLKKKIPDLEILYSQVNAGKGAALRRGVAFSKSVFTIYTDIDFPYTPESLLNVWQDLQRQDVVIGIKDADYYKQVPPRRIWISKILRRIIRTVLQMPITDTQCGLKGFNECGKALFLQTTINRYLCDLEFVFLCFKVRPRLQIVAREIRLRPDVHFTKMKTSILITEVLNFIRILLKTIIT